MFSQEYGGKADLLLMDMLIPEKEVMATPYTTGGLTQSRASDIRMKGLKFFYATHPREPLTLAQTQGC